MKKPKLQDFKREVYDGQDYADWYKEYYQALEKYVDELEQALRIHGQSEQYKCAMQLSKSGKRCEKQCVECELSYKNYSI